jgi:hypothetical protein
VLPHSFGPHRGGFAWYPGTRINGVSFYCRVALYTSPNLSTPQSIGVWAMEVLHMICRFGDLYYSNPPLGRFDVMSCACGTHPSAYTKTQLGWADTAATAVHDIGTTDEYSLIAVSYPQPPTPGRHLAVRIASQQDSSYFVVEARDRSDIYEAASAVSSGIPSEGVVIYQVRDTTDVELRSSGMAAGTSFNSTEEDLTVRVMEALPGGYRVRVSSRATVLCERLQAQADALRQAIEHEQDIHIRKQLISALARIVEQMRTLGCRLIVGVLPEFDEEAQGRLIGERLDSIVGRADEQAQAGSAKDQPT